MTEFYIADNSNTVNENQIRIIGRVFEGSVPLNLVFRFAKDPVSLDVQETKLKVVKISAYGHSLEELFSNDTGELILEGTPVTLAKGTILSTQ